MRNFLSRVAARATGTAPLLRPAATSRHAPALTGRELEPPSLVEQHEEVVAARAPSAAPVAHAQVDPPVAPPDARAGDEEPPQRLPVHARELIAPASPPPVSGRVTPERAPPPLPPPEVSAATPVRAASIAPETIAVPAEPTPAPRLTVQQAARSSAREQRPAGTPAAAPPVPSARPAGAPAAKTPVERPISSAPAAARQARTAAEGPQMRPASAPVAQRPRAAAQPSSPSESGTAPAPAEPPVAPERASADRRPALDDDDDDGLGALDALAARAEAGLIGSFAPLPRGGARREAPRAAPVAPAVTESPSEVRISIGRLEVHAPPAAAPEPAPPERRRPRLALQDYLGRHRGERRG